MGHADNKNLTLSEAGANLIKSYESCLRPVGNGMYAAYLDPVKIPTIGWGTTNARRKRFRMGDRWPRWRCDEAFGEDMEYFADHVRRLVKVPLLQHQFDALVSFTYNLGPGNFAKSTLLKRVNAKDFSGAVTEFGKWNKAKGKVLLGLTRRRKSEADLFAGKPDKHYRA